MLTYITPKTWIARLLLAMISLTAVSNAFGQWPASGTAVVVTRSNGFAIQGQLHSMNERQIKLRSSRGALLSFRGSELRSVQTSNDTFTWDKNKKRFVSARAKAATAGAAKLKGTWCGFMRHLPAGAVTTGIAHNDRYQHSLCLMYVTSVSGSSASGTLLIPEKNFRTSINLTCKPLSNNQREKDKQKFFDVECTLGSNVPLPAGSAGVKRFPIGVALTTHDGLLPKGLTLDLQSVPPNDTHTKKSAFTALVLTRQEDIQGGTPATKLAVKLANPKLDFAQGRYRRARQELYDTGEFLKWESDLIGPGVHRVNKSDWKTVVENQHVPHVRFGGRIHNPTSQAYDVKLVCFFHVDNEGFYSGNVPHRATFQIRVPANKSPRFADGHNLKNMAEQAFKGMGLLGTLVLGTQAVTPQSDKNWHVAHVTKVTAAIVSAKPVAGTSMSSKASIGSNLVGLEFDGDDWIQIPKYRYDGRTPLTVEVIASFPQGSNIGPSKGNSKILANNESGGLFICAWKGTHFGINVADKNSRHYPGCAFQIPGDFEKPRHVAGVIDGSHFSLYVDGKRSQTNSLAGGHKASRHPFLIGTDPDHRGRPAQDGFFSGRVFSVRISEKALYSDDFRPAEKWTADSSTVVLYEMNEGEGNQVKDSSRHGRHATIHGAKWIRTATTSK